MITCSYHGVQDVQMLPKHFFRDYRKETTTMLDQPPGPRTPVVSYRTGYERTAARIIDMIAEAGLKPGERLPSERALGEQMNVSRTVVREAVKLLTALGVVRAQQGSGLYVSNEPHPFMKEAIDISMSFEPKDILSLFEFRTTIELQTVRLATERIPPRELRTLQEHLYLNQQSAEAGDTSLFHESDQAFHTGIARATGNRFFVSAVTTIHRQLHLVVEVAIGETPGSMLVAAEQHAAILHAMREGLPEEAVQAMRAHIETVTESYQLEVRRRLRGSLSIE